MAKNFLPVATHENQGVSSCEYAILGCTIEAGTLNYDSAANTRLDCIYALPACTDSGGAAYILYQGVGGSRGGG